MPLTPVAAFALIKSNQYAAAFTIFIGFTLLFKFIQIYVIHRLKSLAQKTKTDLDDTLIEIVQSLKPPFYLYLSFYLALKFLELPPIVNQLSTAVLILWAVYQTIQAVQIFLDYFTTKYSKDQDTSATTALKIIAQIGLWSVGLLLVLSNMGINVTSLIAGLGVGGVAVALAVQNILGDLLSSFAIYFDKPFKVGDTIVVEGMIGTVEKIGIKTSRIRALQGEEIVIPNQKLTSTNIQNYKQMENRRILFTFGVTYDTPVKKLKTIPKIIKSIVNGAGDTKFDRAHLKEFADSSLNFEVVYYVNTPDYGKYMDLQQKINFQILEAFEKAGIDMAFPTQTVHLQKP